MTLTEKRDNLLAVLEQSEIHEEQVRVSFLVASYQAEALRIELAEIEALIRREAKKQASG